MPEKIRPTAVVGGIVYVVVQDGGNGYAVASSEIPLYGLSRVLRSALEVGGGEQDDPVEGPELQEVEDGALEPPPLRRGGGVAATYTCILKE